MGGGGFSWARHPCSRSGTGPKGRICGVGEQTPYRGYSRIRTRTAPSREVLRSYAERYRRTLGRCGSVISRSPRGADRARRPCAAVRTYMGTSLTRKRTSPGPYRRPMPRVLRGWAFSYGRGTPVANLTPRGGLVPRSSRHPHPLSGDGITINPTEVLGSCLRPTVGRMRLLTTSGIAHRERWT